MRFPSKTLLSLIAFAAVAVPACAADAKPAAPAPAAAAPAAAPDLATLYTQVAAARAKAEAAVMTLNDSLDGHQSGVDTARSQIDTAHQKATEKLDAIRTAEEKKGETKDQAFIDSCWTARNKMESDWRDAYQERNELETRLRQDSNVYQQLRQAYANTEGLERSLKEVKADLGLTIQIYALIEGKAAETSKDVKAATAAFLEMAKTWQAAQKAAENFGK